MPSSVIAWRTTMIAVKEAALANACMVAALQKSPSRTGPVRVAIHDMTGDRNRTCEIE